MSEIERCMSCGDVFSDDGCACPSIPTTIPSTPSREQVEEAFKETAYKYFGDYEMSEGQRNAVDVLERAAREWITFRRTIEQQAQELERVKDEKDDLAKRNQILRTRPDLPMTNEDKAIFKQLEQQLAAMTTERDLLQHRFDDAIEAIDKLQRRESTSPDVLR